MHATELYVKIYKIHYYLIYIMLYFLATIIILIIVFIIRIHFIRKNLNKIEQIITKTFNARTNMIPAIFEVTKWTFSKHDEVFKEILKYRKQELYKYYIKEYTDNIENEFVKLIHIEELIHHELNFIFKVANKHPKLAKKWNFIYLRDLLIKKSYDLWILLEDYKNKVKLYNKIVILPIYKKTKI